MSRVYLSDVFWKHAKIVGFLLVSGVLGYGMAWMADKPELVGIFAPAINYILYTVNKEVQNEGVVEALRQQ